MAHFNWSEISTVLLDMDGTILDLHYDNYFWLEYLPLCYSQKMLISVDDAKKKLHANYSSVSGSLQWYCLDYWAKQTNLPILELKKQVMHLIQWRDDAIDFLNALKSAKKTVVLVTNAHPDALALKIKITQLDQYFDVLYSTHEFGATKESQLLWQRLQNKQKFDCNTSLFIDDNLEILKSAQDFGIKNLLAIANPDSKKPSRVITDFPSVISYKKLTTQLTAQ
jgi:putative hydrolase of the HAD superfamily